MVDNASTDGSPEFVEREFPQARVIRGENRGFSYANNRGFAESESPFVLLLNPDVEIVSDTSGELVELLARRPGVGLAGCRQLVPDGTVYPTIRRFPTPVRKLCESVGSERLPARATWMGERELRAAAYEQETVCDWVTGSFMVARREAVQQAGLMDERYFLYCEEPDLCKRLKAPDWEVRYLPAMTILHYFGKDAHNARLVAQEAYARLQYMFKHHGPIARTLLRFALAVAHGRLAITPGRGPKARARRTASKSALRIVFGLAPPPFGNCPARCEANVRRPGHARCARAGTRRCPRAR